MFKKSNLDPIEIALNWVESRCTFNGKRDGAFISNFNIVLSQEVAFYCILCLNMTALLQMRWLLWFQQQHTIFWAEYLYKWWHRGRKFIACLIFFADEALETQRLKEELHSLILVHTAVLQKKGRSGKIHVHMENMSWNSCFTDSCYKKSQEKSYKTLTKHCLEAVEQIFFYSSRRNVDLSPCFTCEWRI